MNNGFQQAAAAAGLLPVDGKLSMTVEQLEAFGRSVVDQALNCVYRVDRDNAVKAIDLCHVRIRHHFSRAAD